MKHTPGKKIIPVWLHLNVRSELEFCYPVDMANLDKKYLSRPLIQLNELASYIIMTRESYVNR